jgi:polysaccharide export outer membrane protein
MDKRTLKIFLVDDNPFFLGIYSGYLASLGYKDVKCYENGALCLNDLIEKPEVILLDHSTDVLNGLEILKMIKRFNPDIYVVFISAQEDIETAVSSLNYGAFDYIGKGQNDIEGIGKVLAKINEIKEVLSAKQNGTIRRFFSII